MSVNMDLCEQIERFSNFISHYQVHKEYGGDSFYEYAVEELFSKNGDIDAHHNGSHEDNTPIHSHNQCFHPSVFMTTSDSVVISTFIKKERKQHTYYQFQFNSRYLESLFQPPQA
jgi:hypothetical protein